jgi:hypothetical protein
MEAPRKPDASVGTYRVCTVKVVLLLGDLCVRQKWCVTVRKKGVVEVSVPIKMGSTYLV